MKVLFIAHSDAVYGGANRALLELIACLKHKYGVEPAVLLPEGNGDMQSACEELGAVVYRKKFYNCCTIYRRDAKDVLRFLKLLAAPLVDRFRATELDACLPEDFDLVYTNERITVIGAQLAHRRKIPHIWHARCMGRVNRNHFPLLWYWRMARYSDRIVVISKEMFREFSGHVSADKLCTVLDGVDIDKYATERGAAHSGFRVLLTGRLVPEKGQTDAIRALDILRRKYGVDAELFLAGTTPDFLDGSYESGLHQLADALGQTEKVHFLGEVADIAGLRAEMDCELMCSWCEAFGLVSVEAMCAGLPLVGSNRGGTLDIIQDGKTGLLYQVRDPEDLAQKVFWLYRHPVQAQEFGANGKARARDMFSVERNAADVYRVISEVLRDKMNGAKN